MNKITQAWEYFNGKKTAIGAAILTIAFLAIQINNEVVVGIWGIVTPLWFGKTIATLQWIGTAFSGVGLIHKIQK